MIYLASPYSHDDPAVKEKRFEIVCRAAAQFMKEGHHIFSPIAHTHPIAKFGLPGGFEFWEPYDRAFLSMCSKLWVLKMDGWETSIGVGAEIEIFTKMGRKIEYFEAFLSGWKMVAMKKEEVDGKK